jgi:hypothetical protein
MPRKNVGIAICSVVRRRVKTTTAHQDFERLNWVKISDLQVQGPAAVDGWTASPAGPRMQRRTRRAGMVRVFALARPQMPAESKN